MNYDRLVNFVVNTEELIKDLRELQKNSKTHLKANTPAVVFEGFSEITKLCTHVTIRNTADKPIAFNVRKPQGPSFGVDQKLGILKPNEETQLYFQFRGRASRIPDDGVHLYTIYQVELGAKETKLLHACESARDRYMLARKLWAGYTGECAHQLHLPVGFAAKRSSSNLVHPSHNAHWRWHDEKQKKSETFPKDDLEMAPMQPSPAASPNVIKSSELPSATGDDANGRQE